MPSPDDDDDAFLIGQAFEAAGIGNLVRRVADGNEALNYFQGNGQYAHRDMHPLPSLVLLDLQLPKVSGLDVLQWMRKQPAFKTVIVVILAALPLDCEIQRAYLFGANSLLVKGTSQAQLDSKVRLIKEYWLEANRAA